MKSEDLLCAIAETNEEFLNEADRFDAVRADIETRKKQQKQRITAIGIAFGLCVAVFSVLKRAPRPVTPGVSQASGPQSDTAASFTVTESAESTAQTPVTETDTAVPTETTVSTDVQAPPSAEEPSRPTTEAPSEPTTEQPTTDAVVPGGPGTANAVLTKITVDYSTAKTKFGHPLVPCTRGDFIRYEAGIVSRNGNADDPGAYCLSVTYVFANGTLSLTDQDKLTGDSYQPGNRTYRGRSFCVETYNGNGVYEDRIQVGYFPAGTNGIAYQADFAVTADVEEIMDLILSLEI